MLKQLPPRPRIAVIRALQLGDLLCAVPALRALRHALPDAEITLVGLPWAAAFVDRFARYLDHFLEFPGWPGIPEQTWDAGRFESFQLQSRAAPFDLAVQIHGAGYDINDFLQTMLTRRIAGFVPSEIGFATETFLPYPDQLPEIERHLSLMDHLGAPPQGTQLEFPLSAADAAAYQRLVAETGLQVGNYVCVHPGARWPSRRWLSARYAAVADDLSRRGLQVVLTGSDWESELAAEVAERMKSPHLNLVGKTGVGLAARVIAGARLLISNDTGVSHIAAAVRTPSVIVVLGSDPARWAPLNRELHHVVSQPIACRPCEDRICPIGHECAVQVSAGDVLSAARRMLDEGLPATRFVTTSRENSLGLLPNAENDACARSDC